MQSLVSSRLRCQLQIAVRARGVEWESWSVVRVEAADVLARLVTTRGRSEPAPEGDLIAAGGVTARGIWGRVDAEGGYPRPAGVGPGDVLDRIGHESGAQLFSLGTPFGWRSQPPDMVGAEYHRYRVLSALPDAQEGRAGAWFDQPGGGAMIIAEHPVRWYLDRGHLVEIVERSARPEPGKW